MARFHSYLIHRSAGEGLCAEQSRTHTSQNLLLSLAQCVLNSKMFLIFNHALLFNKVRKFKPVKGIKTKVILPLIRDVSYKIAVNPNAVIAVSILDLQGISKNVTSFKK